ncbi:MAG: carboxy-S-adenosyl-L-methionine synthase CmoA [Chloroflexota bacterium]
MQLYLQSAKDDLYAKGPWPKPFVFNEEVVQVFDDMVSRSVPLYKEVMACAAQWACAYHQPNTSIIDIGCSTGTLLELIGRFLYNTHTTHTTHNTNNADKPQATLIGIDNAAAMLTEAEQKLADTRKHFAVELWCKDALSCSFAGSSVVVMNYTLQFLPLEQRQQLLKKIYTGLEPNGLLFMSEKVQSAHPRFQETATQHYELFKASNGYAKSEIERKKEALENVLVPLTYDEQVDMLKRSGFTAVDSLIRLHNFVSFVAIK